MSSIVDIRNSSYSMRFDRALALPDLSPHHLAEHIPFLESLLVLAVGDVLLVRASLHRGSFLRESEQLQVFLSVLLLMVKLIDELHVKHDACVLFWAHHLQTFRREHLLGVELIKVDGQLHRILL